MDIIQLFDYDRLQVLHEGSETFVCRAQDKDGKTFLIKAIKANQPTIEQLTRFEYEYALLSERHVAGVVKVRELIRHYKGHIMIMEDAGGLPLLDAPIFRRIRQGDGTLTSDDIKLILKIFIEMTEILGRIHEMGMIHMNITPYSFLYMPDSDCINILDFGLAVNARHFSNENRHTQKIDSALPYISPEQTGRTDSAIDYRTDFYSLGASIYELITGQRPFATDDPLELVYCHIAEIPPPPDAVNQNIPEMISKIIMKLLEKAPEHRYQNEKGLIHDLEKCFEHISEFGSVKFFELGTDDVSSLFQIPQKLYGRENERKRLKQIYTQVSDGAVRMLIISGYSGVGKTSLVQELCRPFAERDGFFICGKAEQFQKNTPYYILAQAATDLVFTLLQEPDSLLEQWKERLLKALNGNGQLLIDMIPELAAVIGPQPPVNELGPAENRNRFLHTFGNFLDVFARQNHPLTVFLDDLHWCDHPSMELIKYLLSRDAPESLLIIGSYRDNEHQDGHPLRLLMEELQSSEKTLVLPVKPLEEAHIVEMLTDILHCEPDSVNQLAGIVYKKSKGNPFYVKKMLLQLYEDHYIRFSGAIHRFEWNTKEIESVAISDNIVELLINQLMKLPPETQELLNLAALIGNTFDLKVLSAAAGIPAQEIAASLVQAFEREIIQPTDSDYIAMGTLQTMDLYARFRFAHDRVQQACVELMGHDRQEELQLRIGRILKADLSKDELMEHAIDIVSHLNIGIERIETCEERLETAELNLWACQKAKASSDFYRALRYIQISVQMLPENAWSQDYGLTFKIFKTYVECAYLNNDYVLAEQQVQYLLPNAKSTVEQAEIRWMQSTLSNFQGQLNKAIQYALQGLQILKQRVPDKPGMALIIVDLISVKAGLMGKSKEKLLNLPPMKNEKINLAQKLWNEINRAAYLVGNTNLFLLSILKQMQLTLRYGNNRTAGMTYVSYAMILAILGDYKGTDEFCELARMSVEKEKCYECRPTILFSSGFFGHAWNRSWTSIEQWFEKSMEEAVKYGDHHTIALAGAFVYAFKPDTSIRFLIEKSMRKFPLVKQTGNRLSSNIAFLMIHRWLNYAGLTDGQFSLSVSQETYEKNGGVGIIYSEDECLDALYKGNFQSALGVYYKEKAYIHYLYDDYQGALKYLKESDKYIENHTGTPYIVECRMCKFLVLAANISSIPKEGAGKVRRRLTIEYRKMKSWAKHCKVNFEHLQYIMEAEFARLADKPYKAAELYDIAIQKARQSGFMRDEALANELAAKFFLECGKSSQAAFYLAEAYKIYLMWGADAKAAHMINKYGDLLNKAKYHETAAETAQATEVLDKMSMEKASKAVMKEAQIPNLLNQILRTVIENSGAQKAIIILKSEKKWIITAQVQPGSEEAETLQSIPLELGHELLPSSVINFCIRTGENIVLGDAAGADRVFKDPYIQNNRIKSLLCMPVLNQGNKEGVLYLENNLSTNVFTKERVDKLQILLSQYSIIINNVRLFMELLAKTEEAHKASEEVLRSDIAFLQAQIKPHFLYNAINTISAFSLDDSQMARDLLAKLSEYLRGSFDFKNRDRLVTLRKELELVEAYLFIEKARFGDRLMIIYNLDERADCLLPPLVIQPLVENAVLHGISGKKKGGTVAIAVRNTDSYVTITVEDDGKGIDEAIVAKLSEDHGEDGGGVALKNIQRRLTQMYGYGLEIKRTATGGTSVTIRIKK